MTKLVLCYLLISTLTFASGYREYLPHEYDYTQTTTSDDVQKIIRIKTNKGLNLEFKLEKRECDPYVDNCFLSFFNEKNTNFELFGSEVCFGDSCKDSHPKFPNFQLVLRERE